MNKAARSDPSSRTAEPGAWGCCFVVCLLLLYPVRLFPCVFQNLLEKEKQILFSFQGTSPAIWKLCKYRGTAYVRHSLLPPSGFWSFPHWS